MSSNKTKFIVAFLVAAQLAFLPGLAFAQLVSVPTADVNSGNLTGTVSGIAATTVATTAITAAQTANQACASAEQLYFKGDTAATIGFGGLSLISGGSDVVTKLSTKATSLDGFITCRQAVLTSLNAIPTPSIYTANQKQTIYNSASTAVANLKAQAEAVKNQLTVAEQGFWKTLVYNILIKTTQSVTTRMINQLVSNYKIQNFSKYADAVATQVYDNEFIQDNASGSNADQLIMRSMLTNPIAQSVIQPAIYQRTNASLGFVPGAVDVSSNNSNFYVQMASVGTAGNSPFVQQVVLADQAQQAHNKAVSTAQSEIAQSNGLKTPRNCVGTIQQQKSIDLSYKAANDQVANRQALFNSLSQNPNSKPSDVAQAQSDLNAAIKNLQNVPDNSLDAAGNAAMDICTAIVSPPSLINAGINDALKQFDQSLGTYNSNNLPFFINAITSVATQVSNSLIFGGNTSGSNILNENIGNIATGAALAANYVSSEFQTQANNNLTFSSTRNDSGANKASASYGLQWDATGVSGATGVSITGPGLPANMSGLVQTQLSGAIAATVNVPGTYKYTATAYGASKSDVKATVTITITPTQVAGASVSRPLESIRGPSGISPRGNVE